MTPITVRIAPSLTGLLLFAPLLTACGWTGDTGSVKNATELAIDCKTDEALTALDKAQKGGGLGKYLSYLERVGILQDAGRITEAAKAMDVYMALPETASSDPAEVEKSVQEFIDKMQEERKKRTGSTSCP